MAMVSYDSLVSGDKAKIDAMVSSVMEHISVDGNADLDLLMATLERLNEEKRKVREAIQKSMEDEKKLQKKQAAELGKLYVSTLKEGDMITFTYGPARFTKTATLPINKIGAATVQVTYTPEMLGNTSKTALRNVLFEKIIVPEGLSVEEQAIA